MRAIYCSVYIAYLKKKCKLTLVKVVKMIKELIQNIIAVLIKWEKINKIC